MTDIPKSSKKQIPDAVLRKVESMDPVNQAAFLDEFNKKRKSGFMAFVLLIFFGLHYAYLGRIWITLIYWLTFGGLGIWFVIDLFRVLGMVRERNKTFAINVLRDIQILN